MFDDDDPGVTDKDREDRRIHYEQMQQYYLVWYLTGYGALFSCDTASTLEAARRERGLFTGDGYPARIIKLTVVDGEPVAEWVDDE